MRRGTATTAAAAALVSTPVSCCRVPLAAPSLKYAAVQPLTQQPLFFVVEAKSRAKELLTRACQHLAVMGVLAPDLFGLAVLQDGECLFVDPESKLAKYASKSWRSPNSYGLDSDGAPTLVLHLRVQFYVDSPLLLRDPVSRLHYYLQLRRNLLETERACPDEEQLCRLLGCALQADLGDCGSSDYEDTNAKNYFTPNDYLPSHVVDRSGAERLVRTASSEHEVLRGISTIEAQMRFITEATTSSLNLQLHRLQRTKRETPGTAWLGVCARGIDLFEESSDQEKKITASFQWVHIVSLCFERKKFEVGAMQNGEMVRRSFYTGSNERSRQLLLLCQAAHQFSMALGPRLAQLRREHDEAERRRMRDCSLVPRRTPAGGLESDLLTPGIKALRSEQRESVISSASSNTTSGIVSDRVLSFDESESDDLEIEIMINSPPAPISSVESLALAHLQDQEEASDQEEEEEEEVEEQEPPTCRAPETPVATEGSSQCSSSGSTVKHAKEASGSSLELGYSHTAQNSTLSEPTSTEALLDYSVTSAQASAGAYPSRAPSVSLTLDSNSDYVQLPPLGSDENYVQFEPSTTEAEARFITTRPAINVLTAHTVPAPSVAIPSYATPPPPAPPPPPLRLEPRVKLSPTITPPPIVVTRNNYLDVRASGAMATVYTRQLSQSQIEQFKRQLCSDVDYVIFPVRDPAVSRQEYADHKLLTRLLPPPYTCSSKGSLLYRSAPNVQALCPGPITPPPRTSHHQYGGLSSGNLAALRCLSSHSLTRSYEIPLAPPTRAASDDNLLLPHSPPPRPPPRPPPHSRSTPHRPPRFAKPLSVSPSTYPRTSHSPSASGSDAGVLDIRTLREKSRHLDLPLISALCNDRSLLRQTRGEMSTSGGQRRRGAQGRHSKLCYPRQSGSGVGVKTRQTAHTHPTPAPVPSKTKLLRAKDGSSSSSVKAS